MYEGNIVQFRPKNAIASYPVTIRGQIGAVNLDVERAAKVLFRAIRGAGNGESVVCYDVAKQMIDAYFGKPGTM